MTLKNVIKDLAIFMILALVMMLVSLETKAQTYEGTNTPKPEAMENVSPVCKYSEPVAEMAVKLRREGYGFHRSRYAFRQEVVNDPNTGIPDRYTEAVMDLFSQSYHYRQNVEHTKFYTNWYCVTAYGTNNLE